jgi:hypothetical protein
MGLKAYVVFVALVLFALVVGGLFQPLGWSEGGF